MNEANQGISYLKSLPYTASVLYPQIHLSVNGIFYSYSTKIGLISSDEYAFHINHLFALIYSSDLGKVISLFWFFL